MMAVERGGEVTGSGYISKVELTGIANGFKVERKERTAKTATVWGYLPSIKEDCGKNEFGGKPGIPFQPCQA